MIVAAVTACLVLGDSIAQGLAPYRPLCVASTKVGASSAKIAMMMPHRRFEQVIISAGSNDALAPDLKQRLELIRRAYPDSTVTWIAPRNAIAERIVVNIAMHNNDSVVRLNDFGSRDNIHPQSYSVLAKRLP